MLQGRACSWATPEWDAQMHSSVHWVRDLDSFMRDSCSFGILTKSSPGVITPGQHIRAGDIPRARPLLQHPRRPAWAHRQLASAEMLMCTCPDGMCSRRRASGPQQPAALRSALLSEAAAEACWSAGSCPRRPVRTMQMMPMPFQDARWSISVFPSIPLSRELPVCAVLDCCRQSIVCKTASS